MEKMKSKEERNALKEEDVTTYQKFTELNGEGLKQTTGGGLGSGCSTYMQCQNPACGEGLCWEGDYMTVIPYKCPYCGEMTLKGIRRMQ